MTRNAKGRKSNRQKAKLGLPDLEHAKAAVLVSLRSPESQRRYRRSIDDFVRWYCPEPRLSFNKTVVMCWFSRKWKEGAFRKCVIRPFGQGHCSPTCPLVSTSGFPVTRVQ